MNEKNNKEQTAENTAVSSPELPAAESKKARKAKPSGTRRLRWRTNRKFRLGATATAFTVIVVAAVMVLNVIVSILHDRFPLIWDLTADNTYTLSDESREVAGNVKQDVEILVFSEESYFSAPSTGSEEANTILHQWYLFTKEYNSLSGGKVTTRYLDMEADPTLATTYKDYNVSSGSILFRSGDQYRVISLDDLYSEEYDSSSYTTTYSSLVEQKLASVVNALCGGKTVTLTFLTGHGENESLISIMQDLYEQNGYMTDTLNLATASEVDETTGAMVIAGPTTDFSLEEITRLRTWLNNGNQLDRDLFVLCNYLGDCPNLYDFLESDYGITVTDNMLVETDTDNYLMMYSDGIYAPITSVSDTDLTGEIADKSIIMPYTLQLLTSHGTDASAEYVTNYSLVTFGESTELIPQESLAEGKETEQNKADSYPIIGMAYAKEARQEGDHAGETNVIVSGSYLFPGYASLTQYANEKMMLEPIRTLCSLGDTVVISSSSLSTVTLSYSASEAQGIEVVMILVPAALIIVCLVVFLRRRHL